MCQAVCVAQLQPDNVRHARHDTIMRGNQYRRLYPIGLLCYQSAAWVIGEAEDSNSHPPDKELGALTKWLLASKPDAPCSVNLDTSHVP
jgi:hypothetical protein